MIRFNLYVYILILCDSHVVKSRSYTFEAVPHVAISLLPSPQRLKRTKRYWWADLLVLLT